MKKLLVGLLALFISLGLAQTRGGTLTVAIQTEPTAWDPTQTPGADIARVVYDNVLQGLVKRNSKGQIVPSLAERWIISPSGLTYTFYLRKGVKFHDGSPFDASDVVAEFNRAKNPDQKVSGHARPDFYKDIESVVAKDPYTVVFSLRQPNNDFLFILTVPESLITPKGAKLEDMKVKPIGTGPFKFVAWERGVAVRLEANPDYYIKGLPYLDKVNFRFLGDGDAQLAALRAGDIDVIAYSLLPENAIVLQKDPNFKVFSGPSTAEAVASMNNSRAPFNDIRVRKAMEYATNKDDLIQGAMLGYGTKIGSMRSPGEACFVDLSNYYKYDPEQAKKLLAEAGYTAQNPLKFTFTIAAEFPYERRIGEALAAQFNKLGVIQATIQVIDFATWIQKAFLNADYQMTIIGHVEANDTNTYANPKYYWRYNSKKTQDLYTQYLRAPNAKQACDALEAMQRQITEDAVSIWTMTLPSLGAYRATVQNWPGSALTPGISVAEVWLKK
ncbi:MAG: ABC transporter substrate-binding protein [Thermaceae bacterium]|nr:ABC transporter substrate-binding protein [Thermaceae bacterium]